MTAWYDARPLAPASRITILTGPAAGARLDAAADYLRRNLQDSTAPEVLLVGQTREAADELARGLALEAGATFGLHRFGVRQLAWRVAAVELARRGLAPASPLAAEAVATHAAFEELTGRRLNYLHPIAKFRTFGRTLAATLRDLRCAGVDPAAAKETGGCGPDVARLADRYDALMDAAGLLDDAALFRVGADVARRDGTTTGLPLGGPLLLLDVAVLDDAAYDFVSAIAGRASSVFATVPAGDGPTLGALRRLPAAETIDTSAAAAASKAGGAAARDPLDRVRRYLFAAEDPPAASDTASDTDTETLTFFSAPGESREAVEIARAIVKEAARGIPFDEMAIVIRSPGVYAGLVETALARAGVDAYFSRGTRVPHPAGRAFLALLACALENLSARRFSEYLSLGQVPRLDPDGGPPRSGERWTLPDSAPEMTPALSQPSLFDAGEKTAVADSDCGAAEGETADSDETPVVGGTLRAPHRWDELLVDSAVVGGRDRWERRLDGFAAELAARLEELRSDEPESPRLRRVEHQTRNLLHLRRFALPVIDRLAALPQKALWGEWLDHLEALAPEVLKDPDDVLAVLGDLRPMANVGPAPLADVRDVLAERLTDLQRNPPRRRYGRVFVGDPDQLRGRRFRVIFIPGLAERVFPHRHRQDPLLLDRHRAELNAATNDDPPRIGLPSRHDLNQREKLLLQVAVGAATDRIWVSYPRLEASKARQRVPSFYALDIERARTGRIPDFREVERRASEQVTARLAWPAPPDPDLAIDDTEHDLAVLHDLFRRPTDEITGRARYLFHLNEGLRRALIARWARWDRRWSRHDGLYAVSDATRAMLADHRLDRRAYSCSGLQRFAVCPYQFFLGSVARIHPLDEIPAPIEQLDPLTRGSIFHEVQAEFTRALQEQNALPVTRARLAQAEQEIDRILDDVAARRKDELVPAIERVWRDEIETMRTDLKGWLHRVADEGGEWTPLHAEFAFGLPPGPGFDPESVSEPATLDGRWMLRGVVDQIEAPARPSETGELRVTDHKTGKDRTKRDMVVNGGETLQPVLYGLAVEQALGRPVSESQLFFATSVGRYRHRVVRLGEKERRQGIEVLEVIDRAIETGVLVPAPRDRACDWCDFRPVCGPWEERRIGKKERQVLSDLRELRSRP
ncbi:MAG: PD-(D/E)XK nuclease family protein [Acidobacteria bacterium]|nr:PD-(D/E)XK nuclease family protein [Acidobacteriota bacterium]MYJ04031.1 PD-(D/E)XK nuclease family protein [Acidobacteriota bacterium]